MIKSMTGYGKGRSDGSFGAIEAEIKTLNHRYLELSPRLPDALYAKEKDIKAIIQNKITRGRVNLTISYTSTQRPQDMLIVDKDVARRYKRLFGELKKALGVKGEVTLDQLISLPNLITTKPKKENEALIWKAARQALNKALSAVIISRKKEGAALYKDLAAQSRQIGRSLAVIEKRTPFVVERYRKKLMTALRRSPKNSNTDLERLDQDVASFAKSCDISEETTRIIAHVKDFNQTLRRGKDAGRKMDFIAQELHREVNTIASKANDYQIQKEAIKIKGAIERIREQVQNVE